MVKVTGTLQQSSEIMKASNSLLSVPQLSSTMREMSVEMMKAGIMQEMMDDTMEQLDEGEDEEMEEEAQEEVDKVLWQITDGKLGQAGQMGKVGNLPVSTYSLTQLIMQNDDEGDALPRRNRQNQQRKNWNEIKRWNERFKGSYPLEASLFLVALEVSITSLLLKGVFNHIVFTLID